ncbi:MAG TPA: hypothetical protein VER78_00040 [Thermoanaerobaculia bacterium]|nr:hypothetical protein [Thermoanaerobaculia bacterium]
MPEFDLLPRDLEKLFSGQAFAARSRIVLPLLTIDPEGFPRAALLTVAEVRASSRTELKVAVRTGSRTAANLIRREKAALYYLARNSAVWIQARAGRGRTSDSDPDRQIFPLKVFQVKVDQASPEEGMVSLLGGPTFAARYARSLFSEELFEELEGART